MKALTICQPYAHLILAGEKLVENRTWATRHRGPMLIHAGKSREWLAAGEEERAGVEGWPLAFGAIVGCCTLADCLRVSDLPHDLWDHHHATGPWCWVVHGAVRFAIPIPYRGQMGLFDIPDDVIRESE